MVIVYGGTFNPPTRAHEIIVKKIINKYKPSSFIILPVGDNYTWKKGFASFKDRLEMLKIAFKDFKLEISSLENVDNYLGTYHSLVKIKQIKNKEVCFLLGADNLDYIDQWINYKKLIKEFKFIVLDRDNFNTQEIINNKFKKYKNNFELFKIDLNISSSKIRSNLEKTKDINEDVLNYINENHLYEVDKDEA